MRTIIAKLKEQQTEGRAVVLVTLIATEGSTYRRPGARMIITEDGQFHGLVSGGCLEGDLVLHAKKVFFDQCSRVVEYDMRAEEEGVWGLALGCNGLVRIHLQYFSSTESNSHVLAACEYADKNHQPVFLLSELSEKTAGAAPTAIYANKHCISEQIEEDDLGQSWLGFKADMEINAKANLDTNKDFKAIEFVNARGARFLVEVIQAQFHLLVLGAGPDAGPVCTMAKLTGWTITLVDHRVAYVGKAKMLDANRVVSSEPLSLPETVDLSSVDAALLMSHDLNADTDYFTSLMKSSIPCIGMLDPRDRSEIILGRQDKMGRKKVDEALLNRVHAPVGLDIGGEGPEAIALSVIAEIQAHANRRSGQSLREKNGGIHE